MDERCEERIQETEGGQGNAEAVDRDRSREVEQDDATTATRDGEGISESQEVAADEHDVSALSRDVGARAHGDPYVRLYQRRRVVDPVADHRDSPSGGPERLDPIDLGLRQEFGPYRVDSDFRADGRRRLRAIAGEEQRTQAHRPNRSHSRSGFLPHGVPDLDGPKHLPGPGN